MSRKRDERLEEISALKEELRREKARNDVAVITKRLEKVQKERKEQDDTIKALNKAIDNFKEQMTKFSSEKVQLVEENEIVKKKEEFSVVSLRKEIENLKNKVTLVENNRDKK
jgi:chromosome segregation ATPase